MRGFKFLHVILPFLCVLVFLFLGLNVVILQDLKTNELFVPPVSAVNSFSYPILSSKDEPVLSAQAALVIDDESKVVLFYKNPNLRFSTASTAKIMTAMVALDYYKMDDELTIQSDDVAGFVIGFKKGERFKFADLLYSSLLPSANDAALAIAQNYPLGQDAFVEKMNEIARTLTLQNTHFADPAGLIDDQNYTTAIDLARLTSYALKNQEFAQIVSTQHKTFYNLDNTMDYSIYNRNKLLGVDGVDGVKTGYTEEAGEVLVTSKLVDNHRIIIVVMGSQDRFLDTERLLDLVSDKITYLSIHP